MEATGRKFQYLPDLVILDTLPYLSFADLASTYVAGDERLRFFCARTHVLKKASIQELASVYSVGKQFNCDTLKSLCQRSSVLKQARIITGFLMMYTTILCVVLLSQGTYIMYILFGYLFNIFINYKFINLLIY